MLLYFTQQGCKLNDEKLQRTLNFEIRIVLERVKCMLNIWANELWEKKYVRMIAFILLMLIEMYVVYKGGKDLGRDFLFDMIYG